VALANSRILNANINTFASFKKKTSTHLPMALATLSIQKKKDYMQHRPKNL